LEVKRSKIKAKVKSSQWVEAILTNLAYISASGAVYIVTAAYTDGRS